MIKEILCPTCWGKGTNPNKEKCKNCKGTGYYVFVSDAEEVRE